MSTNPVTTQISVELAARALHDLRSNGGFVMQRFQPRGPHDHLAQLHVLQAEDQQQGADHSRARRDPLLVLHGRVRLRTASHLLTASEDDDAGLLARR